MYRFLKILFFATILFGCTVFAGSAQDTLSVYRANEQSFAPDPVRATMLAVALPGLGQVYNKKYWKTPIVYLGFGGVAYSINYFSSHYSDYMTAYRDLSDNIVETDSYLELIPADPSKYDRMLFPHSYSASLESQYKDALMRKMDYYKKYRDFSYIGIGLWYLLTILDAHVDACLFNYDISDNLGVDILPLTSFQPNSIQAGVNVSLKYKF